MESSSDGSGVMDAWQADGAEQGDVEGGANATSDHVEPNDAGDDGAAPASSDGSPDGGAGPDMEAGPDAGADAGPDAGTDAGRSTAGIIASIRGGPCLACAEAHFCIEARVECEVLAQAVADAGSAAGESRAQLCDDTLTCLLTTECMTATPPPDAQDPGGGLSCYCGEIDYLTCDSTPAQGACRTIEEEGLQSTDPDTNLGNFTDTTLGAGMANSITQCLVASCSSSCFP
jgi:hypothetical protein